jgi:hypothetical protein
MGDQGPGFVPISNELKKAFSAVLHKVILVWCMQGQGIVAIVLGKCDGALCGIGKSIDAPYVNMSVLKKPRRIY